MDEKIVLLIVRTLQELKADGEGDGIGFDRQTCLFGREGLLDSLGLVSLVVSVEQRVADEFCVTLSLADEKALSQTKSPYQTVGSLADYTARLIKEQVGNA